MFGPQLISTGCRRLRQNSGSEGRLHRQAHTGTASRPVLRPRQPISIQEFIHPVEGVQKEGCTSKGQGTDRSNSHERILATGHNEGGVGVPKELVEIECRSGATYQLAQGLEFLSQPQPKAEEVDPHLLDNLRMEA